MTVPPSLERVVEQVVIPQVEQIADMTVPPLWERVVEQILAAPQTWSTVLK